MTPVPPMKIPETPRLVFALTLAGLLSGVVIVSAYKLTLPQIQANNAAALRRAVLEVLPGSAHLQRLEWDGQSLEIRDQGDDEAPAIYGGYDESDNLVGYAIPAAGAGFQDTIRLIYGFSPEKRQVVGLAILESRETPGLGDRIYKDEAFVANFRNLSVEPEVVLVQGGRQGENQVDAITGATISSRAVVSIVNSGNDEWLSRLPPEGEEPEWRGDPSAAEAPRGGPVPGGRSGDG
jgi:electron transport complex protein RnfG